MAISAERVFRDEWLAAVAAQKRDLGLAYLTDAVSGRSLTTKSYGRRLEDLDEAIATVLLRGFKRGVRIGQERASLTGGLGLVDPGSNSYTARRARELARGWRTEQETLLRALVQQGIQPGLTARETAQLLHTVVGLTPRHAQAVIRMRLNAAREGTKPALANVAAKTYADRLLRQRADMIALGEVNRARNKGQEALWTAAQGRGLLTSAARRIWVVTDDERLCPVCQAMDGQAVALDGLFLLPDGTYVTTPGEAHPKCRCDEYLDPGTRAEAA